MASPTPRDNPDNPKMSIKSLIQRLLGIPAREVPGASVARLEGRSDWPRSLGAPPADPALIETDGDGVHLAPWDRPGARYCSPLSDPWPVQDDPYAKPEPCEVTPDPAISTIDNWAERTNDNTRRLAERGLTRPMDSVKSVTDLLTLIQRQEDAENHLRKIGMTWELGRGWYLP